MRALWGMRSPKLRVVRYRHSKNFRWVIEGCREGGKRKRLFFKARAAADGEMQRIKVRRKNLGIRATDMLGSIAWPARPQALPATSGHARQLGESTTFFNGLVGRCANFSYGRL